MTGEVACGAVYAAPDAEGGFADQGSPLQDPEEPDDDPGATQMVAEVHLRHFTISFSSAGLSSVAVTVGANCPLTRACDQEDPVRELREKYEPTLGKLTHLELFQALAPGVMPPAPLLAAHVLEADDAGRDNDRVLPLEPVVRRLLGSDPEPLAIQTVATLSVDGTTYRFEAAGMGPDAMTFLTESHDTERLSALTRLAIVHGDLTLLETFLALAPDAEPPLVLVATHPTEIDRIGTRSDDAVRYVTLPPAHAW